MLRIGGSIETIIRRLWSNHRTSTDLIYPLGMMVLNHIITEKQHRAGARFAAAYTRTYGRRATLTSSYGERTSGRVREGATPPEDPERDEADLHAKIYLGIARTRLGTGRFNLIRKIAVYEEMPDWIFPTIPRLDHVRQYDDLIMALEILREVS